RKHRRIDELTHAGLYAQYFARLCLPIISSHPGHGAEHDGDLPRIEETLGRDREIGLPILRLDPSDHPLPLSIGLDGTTRVRRPADQLADDSLEGSNTEGRLLRPPPPEVDVLRQEV